MSKKEKKGFWQEFKEFISRGNILDLAVAVVIGGAFGAIVTSLTNDIIMPLVTWAAGENSLADLSVELIPAKTIVVDGVTVVKEALTWNYGNFLQAVLDFLIIALTVFLFVKLIMKIKAATAVVADSAKQFSEKVKQKENGEDEAETAEVLAQAEEEKTE